MLQLIFGGLLGLYLGAALHQSRLIHPDAIRRALALRASAALKTVLATLGFGMIMTAFLAWLAVIDVDLLTVAPLDGATLLGGLLFGLSLAACGYTPGMALAGVGGDHALESLCCMVGCLSGAVLLPYLEPQLTAVRTLLPVSASTLFQVTLDEPYLWQGGFLGQGCLGAVLLALALYVPMSPAEKEKAAAEEKMMLEIVPEVHESFNEPAEELEASHSDDLPVGPVPEVSESLDKSAEALEASHDNHLPVLSELDLPASLESFSAPLELESPVSQENTPVLSQTVKRIFRPADASSPLPRTQVLHASVRRDHPRIWMRRIDLSECVHPAEDHDDEARTHLG